VSVNNNITESPFDRSDEDLLQELRTTWGFEGNEPLRVVGRLTPKFSKNDRWIVFLEELEHPVQGHAIVYPGDNRTWTNAFVGVGEAERQVDLKSAIETPPLAFAELELSPRKERQKQNNPFACTVRKGSLRVLGEIPAFWNADVRTAGSVSFIAVAASKAVAERVEADLSELRAVQADRLKDVEALADENERERASAEALRDEIAIRRKETSEIEGLHEQKMAEIRERSAQKLRLDRIRHKQEVEEMEKRCRMLSDLLQEKGRRLVALDLIDEDDLSRLLPDTEPTIEQEGHDFTEVFDGNREQLVSFVQARLWHRGMLYTRGQLANFLALLCTHDLVMLAGDSGSGKTSLARHVAEALGGSCKVIPVKPNWTGPEDLLGYYNPISRSYHPTPFLLALQDAQQDPNRLHVICLDEMNLARVEYYFADFLSLLEDRAVLPEIPLYTSDDERHAVSENRAFLTVEAEVRSRLELGEDTTLEDLLRHDEAGTLLRRLGGLGDGESVLTQHDRLRRALSAQARTPTSLRLPSNVRIVGAINVDETTHYLSPKILDRTHVMRFRNPVLADWDGMEAEVKSFEIDLDLPVCMPVEALGSRVEYPAFDRKNPDVSFLLSLARDHLDPIGIEFGMRAIRQSINYIREAESFGIGGDEALNNVILHKVLPKIAMDASGNRGELLKALLEALETRLGDLDPASVPERCVDALGRVITGINANNGIANYWAR
jgi:energy-coupling factor transporter ATP-binding protein EcfA2